MKNASKVLLSLGMLLLIFILSACKQPEQNNGNIIIENEQSNENAITESEQHNISYSFINPNTGQEFEIIHAYMLYENYFETVNDNPDDSPYKLYQQVVIDPVFDACFKDAEHYKFSVFEWTPEESDFNVIRNIIKSINKDHLNKLFEESLIKSSDILSSDNKTTVCVFPKNEKFPSDAMVVGSGKITIFFRKLNNYYKSLMSHEYHHSVWTEKHVTEDYFRTVLDDFIMEGQAVMFETLVYPDLNSTAYVLDENFNKEYFTKVEPYLESSASTELKLGGSNGLPYNYGYSEGYKMIRSYLNLHPDMTVEEWTSKSPKEILKKEITWLTTSRFLH